jgi:predicted Zn-dependent peptidase
MRHIVHEAKFANGAKGLFINIPDATVMSFEFSFRAGEFLVTKPKFETPHIMEHMLLGANEVIPKAHDFKAEFEKNGAYCNASTSMYDVTYEAECADFEWDRIEEMMRLAITKPLFLEEEFKAESGNVREELVMRSNNHFRHLSLALTKAYKMRCLTDQERLDRLHNVTLKDIQKHYKKTHTTSNMRFVIAGKLPVDRRRKISENIEKMLLPKGEGRLELPIERPQPLVKPLNIKIDTVKNIYFYIDTYILRKLRDKEMDALHILNIMMTETLYSKILGTARERGLVYGMSSGFSRSTANSDWWLGAQVSIKNAPALFDIVVTELQAVLKGFLLEEDISAAKQNALGRFQQSGQTVAGTAIGYSYRYFFDEVIDDFYKVPDNISAVTKNDITKITKELFSENIWGFGCLGSCDSKLLKELNNKISVLWQH